MYVCYMYVAKLFYDICVSFVTVTCILQIHHFSRGDFILCIHVLYEFIFKCLTYMLILTYLLNSACSEHSDIYSSIFTVYAELAHCAVWFVIL